MIRILLFIFLVQNFFAAAQTLEVRTYFDDKKQFLKEEYQIDKRAPSQLNGFYRSYYPNGHLMIEGQYRRGVAAGPWRYYYQNGGIQMKGPMEGENQVGHWEYFYENQQKSMEGDIVDGKREGSWIFYYENGSKKSHGAFSKGERIGLWHYYYESGELKAKGLYEGDVSKYKEYYPSGKLKATGFKKNERSDSLWVYYYESSTKLGEGPYEDGLRSGEWTFYHENGNVSSRGMYVQGKRNGHWQYFYEDESLSSEGPEKDNKKDGYWKLYFEDGGLKGEGFFEAGEGVYTEYYNSGKLKMKGRMEDGVRQGEWLYYYEGGALEGKAFFVDDQGAFVGYYESGEVKMTGNIEGNKRVGTWTLYKEDGAIAGYYRTVYGSETFDFEGLAFQDTVAAADTLSYQKPDYKFRANESKYFTSRLNEFKGIIIGANPIAVAVGSFPFSVEHYIQERLGHELQLTLLRDPFFTKEANMPRYALYQRGFSAAFRQKFYQKDQELGMVYFAHELRYTQVDCRIRVPDDAALLSGISVLEEKSRAYEYSVLVGDRITKDAGATGITLDVFIGVGIGYRNYSAIDYPNEAIKKAFDEAPKSKISVPIRAGLTLGYIF